MTGAQRRESREAPQARRGALANAVPRLWGGSNETGVDYLPACKVRPDFKV
jgi:hypothetical protein